MFCLLAGLKAVPAVAGFCSNKHKAFRSAFLPSSNSRAQTTSDWSRTPTCFSHSLRYWVRPGRLLRSLETCSPPQLPFRPRQPCSSASSATHWCRLQSESLSRARLRLIAGACVELDDVFTSCAMLHPVNALFCADGSVKPTPPRNMLVATSVAQSATSVAANEPVELLRTQNVSVSRLSIELPFFPVN